IRDAPPGRILVRTGGDGLTGGLEDLGWTVLIGESLAEVDRPGSDRRRGHLCEDGGGDLAGRREQPCSCGRAAPGSGNVSHAEQAKGITDTHLSHKERTESAGSLKAPR